MQLTYHTHTRARMHAYVYAGNTYINIRAGASHTFARTSSCCCAFRCIEQQATHPPHFHPKNDAFMLRLLLVTTHTHTHTQKVRIAFVCVCVCVRVYILLYIALSFRVAAARATQADAVWACDPNELWWLWLEHLLGAMRRVCEAYSEERVRWRMCCSAPSSGSGLSLVWSGCCCDLPPHVRRLALGCAVYTFITL